MRGNTTAQRGFTLIEMSIVLVIIGLIVGGVLVGQSLINAAAVRAQISQIEKYNTAVNTFRGKYNALPGDMNAASAAQFGFPARGQYAGEGDGNGVIEGVFTDGPNQNHGTIGQIGEVAMFWLDLSQATLIDGTFQTAQSTYGPPLTATQLSSYIPQARIGSGNYVYVYSYNGLNYYGLSAVTSMKSWGGLNSTQTITVQSAFAIDNKIDDGLPQTGRVTAAYNNSGGGSNWWPPVWCDGDAGATDTSTATPPSASTCYDDGGTTGAQRKYSLGHNNGANCALSFQFQ